MLLTSAQSRRSLSLPDLLLRIQVEAAGGPQRHTRSKPAYFALSSHGSWQEGVERLLSLWGAPRPLPGLERWYPNQVAMRKQRHLPKEVVAFKVKKTKNTPGKKRRHDWRSRILTLRPSLPASHQTAQPSKRESLGAARLAAEILKDDKSKG